jgi:hypothetical protein
MKNRKGLLVLVMAVLAGLQLGCGGSKGGLEKEIKASLQQKMATDAPFKDYAIEVGTIKLVKSGTYTYKGTVIMTVAGKSNEVMIDVVSDGQDAVWSIEPAAFAFLSSAPKDTLRAGLRAANAIKEITSAKPAEPNERTDFKYDLNTAQDGVVILQYVGARADVVVPAAIDGFPVTAIEKNAFKGNENIASVVLQPPLRIIADSAFMGCKNLVVAALPGTLLFIGDNAFRDCRSLVSAVIPNGVLYIGISAFNNCLSLSSVVLPNTIEDIERSAFQGCSLLTSIKIPESVGYIFSSAFRNCSNLLAVELPSHPIMYIGGDWRADTDTSRVIINGNGLLERYAYQKYQLTDDYVGQHKGNFGTKKAIISLGDLGDTIEIEATNRDNLFAKILGESSPFTKYYSNESRGEGRDVFKRYTLYKYSITPDPKNDAWTGCFRLDLPTRQRITQSGYEGDFN